MGWRAAFLKELAQDHVNIVFLLESIGVGEFRAFEGDFRLASCEDYPGYIHAIIRNASGFSWGTLNPQTWTRTFGTMSVGILPNVDVRHFTSRGQHVQLRVGIAGWALDRFEVVWAGGVRDLVWRGSHWVLECIELPGTLTGRFVSDGNAALLFGDHAATVLAADFDPASDVVLQCANLTQFSKSSESGDRYCVLVTPSAGGDPYYLLADTKNVNDFEDLTLGPPVLGTTPVEALAGDAVREVAFTEGHPLRVVKRLLTSSGTSGKNGGDDFLPSRWGFNLEEMWLDVEDIDHFIAKSDPIPGPGQWCLVEAAEVEDALAWLGQWLAPGGFFLGMRMGRLTARAVLAPFNAGITPGYLVVTDDDLIPGSIVYNTYDPQAPVEYLALSVFSPNSGSLGSLVEASISSRPVRSFARIDLANDYQTGDEWPDEVVDRLGPFYTRVPERLRFQTAGLRCAEPSIGDVVKVISQHQPSPRGISDHSGERRWLMVGGGPDWFAGVCEFECITVPNVDTER